MISFESLAGFPESYFDKNQLTNWLIACAEEYEHVITRLSYQFCDEKTMLDYNRQYLDHDYYTDILTFPESRKRNPIKGDVLINTDRLVDNAKKYNESVEHELLRLMAHGLLHLCGFNDEHEADKKEMSEAENYCIKLMSV